MGTLNSYVTENKFFKKEVCIISLSVCLWTPFRRIPTMTPSSSSYKPLLRPFQSLPKVTLNQRSAPLSSLHPMTYHAPLTPMTNKPNFSPSAPVYQSLLHFRNLLKQNCTILAAYKIKTLYP